MSQAEFRIGPNGQKQKLNHNRRWENVESGSTKASHHSPSGSASDVSSDFSSSSSWEGDFTPEDRFSPEELDKKQLKTSVDFVNYLLEEGISPDSVISDEDELEEHIADFCEYADEAGHPYQEIFSAPSYIDSELAQNDNNFARAYKEILDEKSKYSRDHQQSLADRALEGTQSGHASFESDPDMEAMWAEDMFSGYYEGTYEDYCISRTEDVQQWQKEDVDSLINEWETRMRDNDDEVEYVVLSSNNAGWTNSHVEGAMSIEDLRSKSINPIGLRGDASFDWVQNKDGKTIDIDIYHHDSPTGEQWTIRNMTPEEVKRYAHHEWDD